MFTIRKIDYEKDKKAVNVFNEKAKYKVYDPESTKEDTLEMNNEFYGEPGVDPVIYGVFDGDELVGAMSADSAGPAGASPESGIYAGPNDYIFSINVLPEYQNKGLGHKLIDEFKKDHNGKLLIGIISVSDDVEKLRKFYESCGAHPGDLEYNNIYIRCDEPQKSKKDKILERLSAMTTESYTNTDADDRQPGE